jgi:hypothetical protein
MSVGMTANMKAIRILRERTDIDERAFTEIVVWRVPKPVRGSLHSYKYRLVLVVDGVCVIRFDNEADKGDHIHIGQEEKPYAFVSMENTIADFRAAVLGWRG